MLADIQLADGSSGLDAVNEMLGSFEVPVIFITAYPDRLLTGERPEPAFLITKPYQPDTVKAIVSQALFFERRAHLARPPAGVRLASAKSRRDLHCRALTGQSVLAATAPEIASWPRQPGHDRCATEG